MDDRELLELAAKAAGMKARWFKVKKWRDYQASRILCGHDDVFGMHHSKPWNPLTDDGDALRLAVKLRISVMHATRHVACDMPHDDYAFEEGVTDGHTRRAIVRAAAQIGMAM